MSPKRLRLSAELTRERRFLNEDFIPRFCSYLKKGDLIYDIGKSHIWDYSVDFEGFAYKSVDIDEGINPDIVDNIEDTKLQVESADAVICNGVTEQCDNPFNLIDGIYKILKKGGYALFGIMSIGYPLYEVDYVRFTPNGTKRLLQKFMIIKQKEFFNKGVPSYIYTICRK